MPRAGSADHAGRRIGIEMKAPFGHRGIDRAARQSRHGDATGADQASFLLCEGQGDIAKLNAAIAAVMREPEVRARLAATGVVPGVNSPAEFATYLKDENERWTRIIREKGIKAE